jgi:SAM-dependent methyltransferase
VTNPNPQHALHQATRPTSVAADVGAKEPFGPPGSGGRVPFPSVTCTPTAGSEPHRARQLAESFGSDATRYDRARPDYPDAMVERIVAATPGPNYLDVGIGTGIAARQFRAKGCHVLGVDVDPRMVELASRGGLDSEVAAFEAWDPAGRTFDGVVSGQTWHWIEPVGGAAKAAAALHVGGRLSLFWNVFRPPSELVGSFADAYRRAVPDLPFNPWAREPMSAYSAILDKTSRGIRAVGAFGNEERWQFDWERAYTREEWLDVIPTTGGHHQLPPGQLDELLERLGATIDSMGGAFTMGYTSVVLTAHRIADVA